ncbi:TraB/VirB10 family protein, partial [Shewanella sairae]
QRMSCIFDDEEHGEEIIDIPVKGTAFNFGRNGIRGTPVMRNGDIVKMAGISGLFTGLGDTAKNASSSQITSPSGVVSTVDPSQALLNMGGSALESVGSKLADYYIKLAEQYHPIIELNPGAVVNLVFLEGFPLDAESIAKYEQQQDANIANTATNMMQNFSNPLAVGMAAMQQPQQAVVNNPLMNQLPPQLQMQAQQFNNIGQSKPTSPFRQ